MGCGRSRPNNAANNHNKYNSRVDELSYYKKSERKRGGGRGKSPTLSEDDLFIPGEIVNTVVTEEIREDYPLSPGHENGNIQVRSATGSAKRRVGDKRPVSGPLHAQRERSNSQENFFRMLEDKINSAPPRRRRTQAVDESSHRRMDEERHKEERAVAKNKYVEMRKQIASKTRERDPNNNDRRERRDDREKAEKSRDNSRDRNHHRHVQNNDGRDGNMDRKKHQDGDDARSRRRRRKPKKIITRSISDPEWNEEIPQFENDKVRSDDRRRVDHQPPRRRSDSKQQHHHHRRRSKKSNKGEQDKRNSKYYKENKSY